MIDRRPLGKSFLYAVEGVYYAFKNNQNLRIHTIVGIIVILVGLGLGVTEFELAILGVMILLVVSSEMINTSIEQMVDLIVNEHRKEAKIAKDVGAGMVLITSVGAAIVGLLIIVPYILKFLRALNIFN